MVLIEGNLLKRQFIHEGDMIAHMGVLKNNQSISMDR